MEKVIRFFNKSEVIDYLNVSQWKFKKLVSEEILIPDKVISTNSGRKAYFYSIFQVVAIKRLLKKQNYNYKFS